MVSTSRSRGLFAIHVLSRCGPLLKTFGNIEGAVVDVVVAVAGVFEAAVDGLVEVVVGGQETGVAGGVEEAVPTGFAIRPCFPFYTRY